MKKKLVRTSKLAKMDRIVEEVCASFAVSVGVASKGTYAMEKVALGG